MLRGVIEKAYSEAMNIGVLEDNADILDYMSVALEMAGHKVQTFTHSAPLMETLPTHSDTGYPLPYDLIIVDLLLPGSISGLETIKRIQQVVPLSKLPVIVISAGSKEELEYVKTSLPDVPVLRKPFKMRILLELIASLKVSY